MEEEKGEEEEEKKEEEQWEEEEERTSEHCRMGDNSDYEDPDGSGTWRFSGSVTLAWVSCGSHGHACPFQKRSMDT